MIRYIKKLFYTPKLIVAVYKLINAWDLVARKSYYEAEEMLKRYEKIMNTLPEYNLPYDYYIIKGKIAFRLDKKLDCVNALTEAWITVKNSTKILQPDKNYLREYIASSLRFYKEHTNYDEDFFEEISMADVDLGKVSKHLQRNFPMRNHPDWYKYNKE